MIRFRHAGVGLAAVVAPLLLAACVTSPGPEVKGSGVCDASQLGWAVGQPANEENLRRLSRESGAGLVNPIGPSTLTTKDIRRDRLRVFFGKDNLISAVRCE
ncbi:I78 family peptidase inhibitor [Stenotrophomonas sp. 24(2023)]|uniref:I78 family peptidase inhibitor n=1 Tax=Stenotrophomonas sp. 24(2023) TaxID=3068324 RepID=UPI0027E0BE7B|nr:I78 family peptidase inhibitor [Stenotrophomonas sp. 24(2023)]WMJ69563.1 I78 family peptidase inhibitor [Stenotrophomonas sp. 24(2023)]